MHHAIIATMAFMPSIILCGGAVYLASLGMSGWVWSWFLIAAALLRVSYRSK